MKLFFLALYLIVTINGELLAQVGISADNSPPGSDAMLDVKSTASGMLPPRMTLGQRNAIVSPAEGLIIFCTDCGDNGSLSIFSDSAWRTLNPCLVPMAVQGVHWIYANAIVWNWEIASIAPDVGYKWNTTDNYANATDMGSATSKTETGIGCGATYNRYVWVYNACGVSERTALSQSITSVVVPATPVPASHIAGENSVRWIWHQGTDVTGYKWGATNNPDDAEDMGWMTSKEETGLACGHFYIRYVWAYNGCGYSEPVILTKSTTACYICGIPFTDSRDGKTYGTVTIGSQCWFAQNLNVGIALTTNIPQYNNEIIEKYCYNKDPAYCNIYGGLYTWVEMMNYTESSSANPSGRQGICPDSWHVPSNAEWCQMLNFLDSVVNCYGPVEWMGEDIGGILKEAGTSHWANPNTGATNSTGFTALPAGTVRFYPEYSSFLGYRAGFWSTEEHQIYENPDFVSGAWAWFLLNDRQDIGNFVDGKTYGHSVRCVKN